jgi:hypothetical protein
MLACRSSRAKSRRRRRAPGRRLPELPDGRTAGSFRNLERMGRRSANSGISEPSPIDVIRAGGSVPMMFRDRAIVRFAAAVGACALAWQTGGVIHLAAQSAMSCCVSAHDATKCPCRFCTHHRSAMPLCEKCPDKTHAIAVVALDVFAPVRLYTIVSSWARATPDDAAPQSISDRVMRVPTPPPIA